MADKGEERAPVPPDGLLPSDYIAIKCQMCGRWSTSLAPWPLNSVDKDGSHDTLLSAPGQVGATTALGLGQDDLS